MFLVSWLISIKKKCLSTGKLHLVQRGFVKCTGCRNNHWNPKGMYWFKDKLLMRCTSLCYEPMCLTVTIIWIYQEAQGPHCSPEQQWSLIKSHYIIELRITWQFSSVHIAHIFMLNFKPLSSLQYLWKVFFLYSYLKTPLLWTPPFFREPCFHQTLICTTWQYAFTQISAFWAECFSERF